MQANGASQAETVHGCLRKLANALEEVQKSKAHLENCYDAIDGGLEKRAEEAAKRVEATIEAFAGLLEPMSYDLFRLKPRAERYVLANLERSVKHYLSAASDRCELVAYRCYLDEVALCLSAERDRLERVCNRTTKPNDGILVLVKDFQRKLRSSVEAAREVVLSSNVVRDTETLASSLRPFLEDQNQIGQKCRDVLYFKLTGRERNGVAAHECVSAMAEVKAEDFAAAIKAFGEVNDLGLHDAMFHTDADQEVLAALASRSGAEAHALLKRVIEKASPYLRTNDGAKGQPTRFFGRGKPPNDQDLSKRLESHLEAVMEPAGFVGAESTQDPHADLLVCHQVHLLTLTDLSILDELYQAYLSSDVREWARHLNNRLYLSRLPVAAPREEKRLDASVWAMDAVFKGLILGTIIWKSDQGRYCVDTPSGEIRYLGRCVSEVWSKLQREHNYYIVKQVSDAWTDRLRQWATLARQGQDLEARREAMCQLYRLYELIDLYYRRTFTIVSDYQENKQVPADGMMRTMCRRLRFQVMRQIKEVWDKDRNPESTDFNGCDSVRDTLHLWVEFVGQDDEQLGKFEDQLSHRLLRLTRKGRNDEQRANDVLKTARVLGWFGDAKQGDHVMDLPVSLFEWSRDELS
jgi:hypothetical protein